MRLGKYGKNKILRISSKSVNKSTQKIFIIGIKYWFKKKENLCAPYFYRMLNSGKKFKKHMQQHSVKLLQL